MVAYSFKAMFGPQVRALTKLQTVRADRKRHARPGEPVQLYQGMRTRDCVKLVEPDPICSRVVPISISTSELIADFIGSISIDGVILNREEIEEFAIADGFGIEHVGDWRAKRTGHAGSARWNMGAFWAAEHAAGLFQGRLVKWEPSA